MTTAMQCFNTETVLFHGSKSGIRGKIKPISRASCDFGSGFYTGDLIYQPQELICKFPDSKLYEVSVDLKKLDTYYFTNNNLWLLFVARNRGYLKDVPKQLETIFEKIDSKDVLIGLIADDSMTEVMSYFFENQITTSVLFNSLTLVKLGNQYVFKTQKACDTISTQEILFDDSMRATAITSRADRMHGVHHRIQKIQQLYRRDGLYFDELLKGGNWDV